MANPPLSAFVGRDGILDAKGRYRHPVADATATYGKRRFRLYHQGAGQATDPTYHPNLKPASASTDPHNAPRSSRPRSDNHRSRNPVIARAPKRNMTSGQEDLQRAT